MKAITIKTVKKKQIRNRSKQFKRIKSYERYLKIM